MERKFIADFMLGRLCRWLRLLGEDVSYCRESEGGEIIYRSLKERRVVLTRNTKLSKKRAFDLFLLESQDFRKQLKSVIQKYGISIDSEKIFTRCSECNRLLIGVDKKEVKNSVPEYVYCSHEDFSVCPACKKIFWKGTHKSLIGKVLDSLK